MLPHDELSVGDCTVHHGWTLHYSPENSLDMARFAYAVSFIADGTRLLNKDNTKVSMNFNAFHTFSRLILTNVSIINLYCICAGINLR